MASISIPGQLQLLAVIVLYKVRLCDSTTALSLRNAMDALDPKSAKIDVLFYDNTPGGQDPGTIPLDVIYRSDPENGGLAAAYNYAIGIARERGIDWMLTLDQDTSLPPDFLTKLCDVIRDVSGRPDVAAIVPHLASDGQPLSPWTPSRHWARVKRSPVGFVGIPTNRVYAANSASTMRISAVHALEGYDPRFRLDFSDLVMYHRLQNRGFKVYVAGNIHVEHELSGFDLRNRSSPARYTDFHVSEEAFYDEYLGELSGVVLFLRMIHRLGYRLWSQGGNFRHFRISFVFLYRRIRLSRRDRRVTREQLVQRERFRH